MPAETTPTWPTTQEAEGLADALRTLVSHLSQRTARLALEIVLTTDNPSRVRLSGSAGRMVGALRDAELGTAAVSLELATARRIVHLLADSEPPVVAP